MSRVVKNNIDVLRALTLMKPVQRQAVIKVADKDLIHSVCECAYNVLKGNVSICPKRKKQLSKFKSLLRKLVKKGECLNKKKKYLIQKGGGVLLPILLSAVLQAILR